MSLLHLNQMLTNNNDQEKISNLVRMINVRMTSPFSGTIVS